MSWRSARVVVPPASTTSSLGSGIPDAFASSATVTPRLPRPLRRLTAHPADPPPGHPGSGRTGIELTEAFPKPLTDDVVHAADVIVTMGCGDACPVFPGKHYEDWAVADPAGQPIEVVRAIRDDIQARVTTLLGEILHQS